MAFCILVNPRIYLASTSKVYRETLDDFMTRISYISENINILSILYTSNVKVQKKLYRSCHLYIQPITFRDFRFSF